MLCKQWLAVCSQQWWLSSKQMQFQCPHSATLPLSHWHMYTDHTKSEHLSTQCAQFDTPHWPHFEVCWFCRGWTYAAWWWWSPTLLGSCVCICICICVKVLSRNHKNELQADDGGRPLPCHYQSLVVTTHHQSLVVTTHYQSLVVTTHHQSLVVVTTYYQSLVVSTHYQSLVVTTHHQSQHTTICKQLEHNNPLIVYCKLHTRVHAVMMRSASQSKWTVFYCILVYY